MAGAEADKAVARQEEGRAGPGLRRADIPVDGQERPTGVLHRGLSWR